MDEVLPVPGRDHVKGNEKSPVTILEYGDYECPFCGKAYYVIDRLLKENPDMFRYSFRNFPLTDVHPHALTSALAAEAAALQDKFWEMHSLLYENQSLLNDEHILAYAEEAGLDTEKFLQDIESKEVAERVREDLASGVKNGVNSTPTFFINGMYYSGPYDYGILSQIIKSITADEPYNKVTYDYNLSHSKN